MILNPKRKMRSFSWRILGPVFALVTLYLLMSRLMGLHDILDSRLYYSAEEASLFFRSLSPSQMDRYFKHELLDLLFLTSYTLLDITLLARLFPEQPRLRYLGLVPGFFDALETLGILAVLTGAPISRIVPWLGIATCLKWITGAGIALMILVRLTTQRREIFLNPLPKS
jgi:hypothetical protein